MGLSGLSRSPAMVLAFLMQFEQLTLSQAAEVAALSRVVARLP